MTKKTVYPHTVSQTSDSGNSYREFSNLGNVKNNKDTYARTGQIASKSGTHKRPSAITCRNFKANIPAGSKINSVTVEYAADYEGNISIGKSTIDILNISGSNKNGKALTKTMTKSSATWSGNQNVAKINSSDFGVKISFPANTKADVGYVKVKYVRIIIDYTVPNYSVTSSKISGQYTNDEFKVKINASNVNKTTGDSNVTINLPAGVSYIGKDSGDGSVTASGSKISWKPGLSDKVLNRNIVIKLKITTDNDHKITISEAASNHKTTLNINTVARPTYNAPSTDEGSEETLNVDDNQTLPQAAPATTNILQVSENEEFQLNLTFEDYSENTVALMAYKNDYTFDLENAERTENIKIYSRSQGIWFYRSVNMYDSYNKTYKIMNYTLTGGLMQDLFKIDDSGYYTILIYASDKTTLLKKVMISVKPSSLSGPVASLIKLTEEELNRLGHGIVYTVQSNIKLTSNELFIRDWSKNFRIGVMNNINPNINTETEIIETETVDGEEITIDPVETDIIDETDYENLTISEIIDYAEYWSDSLKNINAFEDLTVNFPYNKDYPVYIIITGDYVEGNPAGNKINFTEPCIIESRVYTGREKNGNFPVPILSTIIDDDLSEINLALFEKGNDIVLYDFPLGEDFGTNDDIAVTGIELLMDVEYSDQCVLSATLIKPDGDHGDRSVILNDADDDELVSKIKIGGNYDLWGFNVSDIKELEDWKLQLTLNNTFSNTNETANIKFKNIQLSIYAAQINSTLIGCKVNDEDVRYYQMFLEEVTIPEGLVTDTKYINVDGTDTNDPYRMNLKQKTIELKFGIEGCTIDETTELLRQLARLFVNERDELNRPIPKRIEFSHYPDVYFLYILEDAFDSDVTAADYESTVKLTIPAGTGFAKEDTVSNINGVNSGIAKVNPIIVFIPTGDAVEITETVNDQHLKITCSEWSADNTVEINCINRTITILDYVDPDTGEKIEKDITYARDYNSDWFVLMKEYRFKEDNCIIQSVTFTERR